MEIDGFSLPADFCSRMQDLMTAEEYQAFLASYGRKRLFSLRVNPLKSSREKFAALFGELSPVPWEPDGVYYPEEFRPGRLPLHEAGMYYIQEASAMVPARLCGVRPGERVLDLCAAPGGKSTKLAADLRGRGLLVANEIHPERARVLSANLERTGVRNALVTNASPQELASRFPLFFDRILVDAPCSGEGMFRKEEEALLHWSRENVRRCAARQREILEEAAVMLREGGTLVYSTCTFAPEENEGTILHFLKTHPEFSIVRVRDLPGIEAEKWGFAPGLPCPAPVSGSEYGERELPEDAFSTKDARCSADLAGNSAPAGVTGNSGSAEHTEGPAEHTEGLADLAEAVRLWPHRLEGEGHFAAVLRKADRKKLYKPAIAGGESASGQTSDGFFDDSDDSAEETAGMEGMPCSSRTGYREISAREYPEASKTGKKSRRAKKLKKSGGKKAGRMDPKEAELRQLWRTFREETLVPGCLSGTKGAFSDLPAEDRLCCFGDMLYLLPVPRETLPLDGLRVLRAGLQLGSAVKGRFVPSHSLGMALREEEALRSVIFSGQSEAAFAWFRGEAVPLPADAGFSRGWVLVCIDGCAAGWGKAAGAMIKNHYPRGLRKGSSYRPAR